MSATILLPCSCDHPYQDSQYGRGIRVHNEMKTDKNQKPPHRCTVCSKVKG